VYKRTPVADSGKNLTPKREKREKKQTKRRRGKRKDCVVSALVVFQVLITFELGNEAGHGNRLSGGEKPKGSPKKRALTTILLKPKKGQRRIKEKRHTRDSAFQSRFQGAWE